MREDLDERPCYGRRMSDEVDVNARRPPASVLRELLNSEAAGGLILMAAAALAMLIANSPVARSNRPAHDPRTRPE